MQRPTPTYALAFLSACALPNAVCTEPAETQRTVIAMGTALHVTARGQGAEQAAEQAIRRIQEAEGRWSSWLPDSLVSQIHSRDPGSGLEVDQEFSAGWRQACAWSERTGGAFDPSIGSLLRCWGIGAQPLAAIPTRSAVDHARRAAGLHLLRLEGSTMRRAHPNAQIAEGGFVKGLALDRAIAQANTAFPNLQELNLDFGGQLAWWSTADDDRARRQSLVVDPRDRTLVRAAIRLGRTGSLATSGNSERGILIDGRRYSHIVDPRTGETAPDWGSVTVLTLGPGSACAADCLSTALFILGPIAGLELANRLPDVEALFLQKRDPGLAWHMTDGMRSRLTRTERLLANGLSLAPR